MAHTPPPAPAGDHDGDERPVRDPERGQVVPLLAGVLAVALLAAAVLAAFGGLAVDRARARAAADGAALAGAAEGPAAARRVAAANDGTVEAYREDGTDAVEVTVRVGRARATSRAVARPAAPPP